MHFNELPLRHLLLHLDGTTTGPKCFSGPIEFTVIPTILPEIARNELSIDQKYLYDIKTAICTGRFASDLVNIETGLLNHSR